MSYFNQEYIDFFKELAANNNRDWFQANKKRYEKHVKEPFKAFVEEMIKRMKAEDPAITMEAKDSIFRINRDIRFSADKSPYKLHMSAMISAGGKQNKSIPGIYFQFDTEHARIYSGSHMLEKDMLEKVRNHIANNLGTFEKLINDKTFTSKFGEIHGEKNKRLPKELQDAAEKQPLLFNKSFYYFDKLPPDTIFQDDLPDILMSYYEAGKPLKEFLSEPLLS